MDKTHETILPVRPPILMRAPLHRLLTTQIVLINTPPQFAPPRLPMISFARKHQCFRRSGQPEQLQKLYDAHTPQRRATPPSPHLFHINATSIHYLSRAPFHTTSSCLWHRAHNLLTYIARKSEDKMPDSDHSFLRFRSTLSARHSTKRIKISFYILLPRPAPQFS